ncbi:MAG: glycoside hydrolase family 2 TIM barrel-domain containing protein [Flavobacteriales bacterium]
MKNLLYAQLIIFGVVFLLFSFHLKAQQMGASSFNENWFFHLGDISLNEVNDNNIWKQVDVPHDWSVHEPFSKEWASGTGYLPGGIGWYKKTFDVENWNHQNEYAIYFDGIYKNSEVWLNGDYLGKRPNGFIPFQYDLTPYLKDKENVIIIKVDHTEFADSRFYTGSGLYRNVYFITQEKLHFSQWGVFFKTPKIESNLAVAEVEVAFENNEDENKNVQIKGFIKDDSGTVITQTDEILTSKTGKNNTKLNFSIKTPKLWSPESPYLYHLTLQLWSDDKLLDEWNEKVGIRYFEFDPNKGFFLNGKNMLMKGVCIHHDAGALGAAVPKEVWKKRLETLKELGCNAIRMSHYPHQDYIYDLCDEMGFLVQDEAFDEWEVGKNKWIEGWNVGKPGNDGSHTHFKEWGKVDLKDMILRNRNHPSIIMWSIGNEIDYPNDPYSHPVLDEGRNPQIYGRGYEKENPSASRLGEIAGELVKEAKIHDTTRPITAALAGVTMSNQTSYPSELDMVGYNYQEYRYEEDHKAFPKRIIYGSENGDSLEAWRAVEDNDFISSQFLWTAFDFLGEARAWPSRSSNAGIIDLAGKPKPDFYFRKSLWNSEPMVYIGIANDENSVLKRQGITSLWDGTKGEAKWVTCYANTDEVELFLNGKSLGKKQAIYSKDKMISWEVLFEPGELLVKGYTNGHVVSEYRLNTSGSVVNMQIEVDKTSVNPNNKEIIHLDVTLMDEQGNRVPNKNHEVIVEVSGPAKLIGLESGDVSSHENYQAHYRKTYGGQLRAYIQTTNQQGDIKIKIKSGDLPEKEILIKNITN